MDHRDQPVYRDYLGATRAASDQENRKRHIIGRSALLSALDADSVDEVVRQSSVVKVARRRPIHSQGEPGNFVYFVGTGRALVVRRADGDREFTVAYRGVGDIVGETPLAVGGAHRDGAIAIDQLEVLRVPTRLMSDLLEKLPKLSVGLLRVMAERRLEAERRIEALLSRTVESRVADFLIRAAETHGIAESRGRLIGVKFTHQEIANYVGSTRETVTLTLGDMKRRGLILFDHRRVVVQDEEGLRKLA
jgi:CRP/FNR family transcriptional regulator, cyclic AMP receptor protein